jgi:ankyrin repeat protein
LSQFHSSGTDVGRYILNGEPLVVLSSRYNSDICVIRLLELRADVNAKCTYGRTPLWHAARNGNHNLTRQLYSFGAEIDEPDLLGITPFTGACTRGSLSVVQFLYRLSPPMATAPITITSGEMWPPLFLAMGYGQRLVCEFLITRCGPVALSYRDQEGRSAVFMAVNSGYYELADCLIQHLLNLRSKECKRLARDLLCIPNKANVSPIWIAALHGEIRCIFWLLETLKVHFAFTETDIYRYVNFVDCRNASPLFVAVQNNHIDCARLLIENRAEVDFEPRSGLSVTSPLVRACIQGNLGIVKLLLHSGARRYGDLTAMPAAETTDNRHVVRYLDETRGYTSRLHYAAELPAPWVLELLRSGVNIDCCSERDDGARTAWEVFETSPVHTALNAIEIRREAGKSIPPQLTWVVAASQPWQPSWHHLFPKQAREVAAALFRSFAIYQAGNIPRDIWITQIIPFAVSRGSPLSRVAANAIWPGDGRASRSTSLPYRDSHVLVHE